MKSNHWKLTLSTVGVLGLIGLTAVSKGHFMKKPIEILKVRLGVGTEVPDPAKIEVAGDWYVLDHISSGLIAFDHESGTFKPLLAKSMDSHSSGVHQFTLREDAKFHDGTPILASDVVASIKRLLIRRSSTHFPLWEYVEGCEKIKSLSDPCLGLKAINALTLEIRLKFEAESFFLQLASPETGIWAQSDIDPTDLSLKPTKFSGPYFLESNMEAGFLLKRNEQSPISKLFDQSPRAILIARKKGVSADDQLQSGDVDLIVRSYKPFGEASWEEKGFSVRKSSPCDLYYLYGTTNEGQSLVGRDFLQAVRELNTDSGTFKADTFLPFGRGYSLTTGEVLNLLPESSAKKVRIVTPWTYVPDGVLNLLREAGKKVGMSVEITRFDRDPWLALFDDPKAKEKTDFILNIYAASERYPAVQLRYMTGTWRDQPIDLKRAETPNLTPEKMEILRDFQKWMVKNEHAVPLFFVPMLMIHREGLDLGNQPPIDAEIELWRVQGA